MKVPSLKSANEFELPVFMAHSFSVAGKLLALSEDTVDRLAQTSRFIGTLIQVVFTAALSPASATARMVLEVNVVGVATTTDTFGYCTVDGASVACVAGIIGNLATMSTDFEHYLVKTQSTTTSR